MDPIDQSAPASTPGPKPAFTRARPRRDDKSDKPDRREPPQMQRPYEPPAPPRMRDIDKDIEAELAAAMTEFSESDVLEAEASPSKGSEAA